MYMPVLVYSEIHAVDRHGKELASLGTKALIVTGKNSSRANGALQDVTEALQTHGCESVVFDAVEENPSVDTVCQATLFGRKNGVDVVIGIGGGSPLDAAKAVAFLLAQPEGRDMVALMYEAGNDRHLPMALIPTTCGTGSEVTPVSVLTVPDLQTKKSLPHRLFADIALIDGRYLTTAPITVLRNTALDALTHLIESYLNRQADDFSRMLVNGGLSLWRQNKEALESGVLTDEQRQSLMNASAMAGMAIAQTGTTLPHSLSYMLTIQKHIPHGQAVGYFTAGFLAEAPADDREYLLQMAGFKDLSDFEQWYFRWYGCPAVPLVVLLQTGDAVWKNQPRKIEMVSFPVSGSAFYRITMRNFEKDRH